MDDWIVDSAGIGSWYVGRNPDNRATETIRNHDIRYSNIAQQVSGSRIIDITGDTLLKCFFYFVGDHQTL